MLPSQIGQQKSRRNHMYRRRRGNRRPVIIILLVVLGLTIGVWYLRGSSDGAVSQADAGQHDMAPSNGAGDSMRIAANDPKPKSSETQSPSIMMGRPLADDRATTSQPASQTPTAGTDRPSDPPVQQPQPTRDEPPTAPTRTIRSDRPSATQSHDRERSRNDSARQRAIQRLDAGMELLRTNRPIEARRVLTQALESDGMDPANAQRIRETLTELNEMLIFSPAIVKDDPFAFGYTIRPGDSLARITSRENLAVDWRLIQRINRITRPERIQAGQTIKLVTGPFHVVVHKSDFRMDVFLGDGSERAYVRSFPVGLGEYNSTPVGRFRVTPNSKLVNPAWTNPRTGEHFAAGDPANPIGTRWIGMEGISDAIQGLGGYGIHGTIEPQSIGRQDSMGCIRMHEEDVELVYEMLVEAKSIVSVVE